MSTHNDYLKTTDAVRISGKSLSTIRRYIAKFKGDENRIKIKKRGQVEEYLLSINGLNEHFKINITDEGYQTTLDEQIEQGGSHGQKKNKNASKRTTERNNSKENVGDITYKELVRILEKQLSTKDKEIEFKNKQISELHILLSQEQQKTQLLLQQPGKKEIKGAVVKNPQANNPKSKAKKVSKKQKPKTNESRDSIEVKIEKPKRKSVLEKIFG